MKILIATPIDAAEEGCANVVLGYAEALRQLARHVEVLSTPLIYAADVVRARNRMLAFILDRHSDATHVLWWDSDTWPAEARIVLEMAKLGEDMVAAPYTGKRVPLKWTHVLKDRAVPDARGLVEAFQVGFGFTMTTMTCLRRVSDASRRYSDWVPHKISLTNAFGQLFESTTDNPDDDALLSEDYSFCKRWRELGGSVKVWTRSGILYHAGPHAWSGAPERVTVRA